MVKGEFGYESNFGYSKQKGNFSEKYVLIYIADGIKFLSGECEMERVIFEVFDIGGKYLNIKTSHLTQRLKCIPSKTKLILQELCFSLLS